MTNRKPVLFSVLFIAALALSACGFASGATATPNGSQFSGSNPNFNPTALATRLAARETQQAAAAETAVPPTPTPPPTNTPMPTQTPTPTPAPVMLTVNQPTYCRQGPGIAYPVIAYFVKGDTAQVVGRDTVDSWWVVLTPKNPQVSCWIDAGSTSITSGDPSTLTYMLPPVFTPTP